MIGSLLVLVAALCAGAATSLFLAGSPLRGRPAAADRRPMDGPGAGVFAGARQRIPRVRRPPDVPIGELLSGLAAELAAGQPPVLALEHAAQACRADPCPRARAAARTGGDVPRALREDARAPGAADLDALAACWQVAAHSGAGLAQAVGRLAEGIRATREARGQLDAEIAAARASAKLLAALPLFGLALGQWLGARPLEWLLGSWLGRFVLLGGLVLELLGLAWLHRMVAVVRVGL